MFTQVEWPKTVTLYKASIIQLIEVEILNKICVFMCEVDWDDSYF